MRNSKVIREEIGEVKTSLDALENLVSDEGSGEILSTIGPRS